MDEPESIILVVGIGACLTLLALLSAIDSAMVGISRRRLNALQAEQTAQARSIIRVLNDPARYKATALLLNTTLTVISGACVLQLTDQSGTALRLGALGGLIAVTMLVSEALPKSLVLRNQDAAALWLARMMVALIVLFWPIVTLITIISRPLIELVSGQRVGSQPLVTEEEFRHIVNVGEEAGVIEQEEREMIEGIFATRDTLVREVMIPRPDVIALEEDTTVEDAVETIMQGGHSRVPVYHTSLDKITGVLYAKDLLPALRDGQRERCIAELTRPPYFVPELAKVDALLKDLQSRKVHMAIVVDEYGGTSGLVTIEDLIEEIVGDIQDEFDVEEPEIEIVSKHELVADARVSISEVNDILGLDLTARDADTIGGLVYELLGRVPHPGDVVNIDHTRIEVLSVEGVRPRQLRVSLQRPLEVAVSEDGPEGPDDGAT